MIKWPKIKLNLDLQYDKRTKEFKDRIDDLINDLHDEEPANLNSYKSAPFEFGLFSLMCGKNDKLHMVFTDYLELGVRHLQREFCTDEFLDILFGGKKFTIKSTNKKQGTDVYGWWNLFSMALILRHEVFKKELLEVYTMPQEQENDPFWLRFLDLILICAGEKKFEDSILDDITKIVNKGIVGYHDLGRTSTIKSKDATDFRKIMHLPIANLYYHAYQKNEQEFNSTLEQYLLNKKEWIIKNKEENSSFYWIDFPVLGCCAFAYDRGVTITVESEYIPAFVYRGEMS